VGPSFRQAATEKNRSAAEKALSVGLRLKNSHKGPRTFQKGVWKCLRHCVCMYVCIHVCMDVCMYGCMYVCVYECM
jgi:hypothetical protein